MQAVHFAIDRNLRRRTLEKFCDRMILGHLDRAAFDAARTTRTDILPRYDFSKILLGTFLAVLDKFQLHIVRRTRIEIRHIAVRELEALDRCTIRYGIFLPRDGVLTHHASTSFQTIRTVAAPVVS